MNAEALAVAGERVANPARHATAGHATAAAIDIRKLSLPVAGATLTLQHWAIRAGETVALIGRNGIGKTSVMEAILGLRDGVAIEGTMLGADLRRWRRQPALRKRLGVQLQRSAFPGRPRVKEIVALHRTLFDRTSEQVMAALGIGALSDKLYEFLSRGETQRVDLFLAMAHEPELLFLDEPFTGLDSNYSRALAALIAGAARTTTVLCCHTTEELALADRIAWLTPEGIARFEAPEALRKSLVGDYRLVVECEDEAAVRSVLDLVAHHGHPVRSSLALTRITLASEHPVAELARALVDRADVLSVETGRTSMIDVLRHCAKGEA